MMKRVVLLISVLFVFSAICFGQPASSTQSSTSSGRSSTPTKKPAVFRPTKDQIKQVQTILKEKTLYKGDASGTYNDDTRTAIKSFQKTNGLKETGTLNRLTLEKFGVALTDAQKAIPVSSDSAPSKSTDAKPSNSDSSKSSETKTKKPAPFRATEDQIKAAQKLLKDGKMYMGEQTGKLDDPTRDGLGKYQQANSLKVTKTLNAVTLEKMGIALTDKQKADAAAAPKK